MYEYIVFNLICNLVCLYYTLNTCIWTFHTVLVMMAIFRCWALRQLNQLTSACFKHRRHSHWTQTKWSFSSEGMAHKYESFHETSMIFARFVIELAHIWGEFQQFNKKNTWLIHPSRATFRAWFVREHHAYGPDFSLNASQAMLPSIRNSGTKGDQWQYSH